VCPSCAQSPVPRGFKSSLLSGHPVPFHPSPVVWRGAWRGVSPPPPPPPPPWPGSGGFGNGGRASGQAGGVRVWITFVVVKQIGRYALLGYPAQHNTTAAARPRPSQLRRVGRAHASRKRKTGYLRAARGIRRQYEGVSFVRSFSSGSNQAVKLQK